MSQEHFKNVSETVKASTGLMYPNPSHSPNDIQGAGNCTFCTVLEVLFLLEHWPFLLGVSQIYDVQKIALWNVEVPTNCVSNGLCLVPVLQPCLVFTLHASGWPWSYCKLCNVYREWRGVEVGIEGRDRWKFVSLANIGAQFWCVPAHWITSLCWEGLVKSKSDI